MLDNSSHLLYCKVKSELHLLFLAHLKKDDEGKTYSQDQPELGGEAVVSFAPVVFVAGEKTH